MKLGSWTESNIRKCKQAIPSGDKSGNKPLATFR